jgi:hypothetical protein
MRRAIAAAAVAVSLTGCSGVFGSAGGTVSPTGNNSAAARQQTCTIYAQQHAAQVIVSPDHQSECDTLISDLTGGGIIWSFTPNGNSTTNLTQQCDVTNAGFEAVVLDDSGASLGQSTCSGFETAGWTASTQPGPLARYVTAQQQASQQQQASASASVVQVQQVGSAQQTLSHDVGTLDSDSSALAGSTSVPDGVNQMMRDYAQEQSDYQQEQHASCPTAAGDAQTVAEDAATVGTDLDTLNGDIENLQIGHIQTVQGDLSSVNSDLSSLQSLGVAPAVNSAPAVAAANRALTRAWAVISSAQDQGKAMNGTAQTLLATAHSWASRHGC